MDHTKGLNQAQKKAVEATEGPVLVLAGAGAGKTRTIAHRIVHLVKSSVPGHQVLAITFTNKAAREMRERVVGLLAEHGEEQAARGVTVATFHALAVQLLRQFATEAKLPKHFTIFDRTDSLRAIKKAIRAAGEDDKQTEPRAVLGTISRAKGDAVTLGRYREETGNAYFPIVVAKVWENYHKALRKEGALDFDDLLLELWRLLTTNEQVRRHLQDRFHYLHIDEYQDTNKVQYEIVRLLAGDRANVFCVGDLDQCLPGTTHITRPDGTVTEIQALIQGDEILSNYGNGDMRPARISRISRNTYTGQLTSITLASGATLSSTPEHMHFAGYRVGTSPQQHYTYLMWKQGVGFRLGVSQLYTEGQRAPMPGFQLRCNHEHADAVWVVSVHATPNEARKQEYVLSLRYQLPTVPFVARKGTSTGGYVHDQGALDSIFASFDTDRSGRALLKDFHLSFAYPHHRAQATRSERRNIVVTLCGDRRGTTPMHRISLMGTDDGGRTTLVEAGFSVRPARKGSASWRFETASKNYAVIQQTVERLGQLFPDAVVIQNARLGAPGEKPGEKCSLPFIPAMSVREGMVVFGTDGTYDTVVRVEQYDVYETDVYDLDVEHTHNYIAEGMHTHNSIYAWRGASTGNILEFERTFPRATTIKLEQNYRSTQTIVAVSNDIIKKNTKRKEKTLFTENPEGDKLGFFTGFDEYNEAQQVVEHTQELLRSGAAPEDIAVLYRANFQSRALEEAFLTAGIPYRVLGTRFFDRKEVKDALSYVRAALNQESTTDIQRVINTPTRGIGKVTVDKLFGEGRDALSGRAQEKVDAFYSILSDIAAYSSTHKASEVLAYTIDRSGIGAALSKGKLEEDQERLENVKELVSLAANRYDDESAPDGLLRMLEDAALATDQDEMDQRTQKQAGVTLMTIHAAKGLEFDYVFITGLEDGLFPHERMFGEKEAVAVDDEEERRLFYVALTRAKKKVFLSYAQVRTVFGQRSTRLPSEFILDIDEEFIDPSETRAEPTTVVYLD